MTKASDAKLWNDPEHIASYPSNEKWQAHLLDQYKLYVEMADRISQRRTSANTYFLSVNSAILAFLGYLKAAQHPDAVWLPALAGCLLAFFWYYIVLSYKNLNSAKFKIVHYIEKRLPISPYDAEWELVQRGNNPQLYRPLTHIESWVPWVFFVLHAIVFLRAFPWSHFAGSAQALAKGVGLL